MQHWKRESNLRHIPLDISNDLLTLRSASTGLLWVGISIRRFVLPRRPWIRHSHLASAGSFFLLSFLPSKMSLTYPSFDSKSAETGSWNLERIVTLVRVDRAPAATLRVRPFFPSFILSVTLSLTLLLFCLETFQPAGSELEPFATLPPARAATTRAPSPQLEPFVEHR